MKTQCIGGYQELNMIVSTDCKLERMPVKVYVHVATTLPKNFIWSKYFNGISLVTQKYLSLLLWCTELREKHRRERENLTLLKQPIKTIQFFSLATVAYLKRLISYILKNGGWISLSSILIIVICILLIIVDGPHEKVILKLKMPWKNFIFVNISQCWLLYIAMANSM